MSANIREKIIALSTGAQTAIDTAAGSYFSISEIGADLVDLEPIVEDDANEYGKGHEFAEQSFLVGWNVKRKIDVYACAEMLAWAAAYGLGDGNSSLFRPIDPVTNTHEIDLPWATMVEAIRQGPNHLRDMAFLGMSVENFKLDVKSGPGRANSKLEINLTGTGKRVDPSGITIPARTPVNLLPSASLTATILGQDYITSRNFVSLELNWDNNIREASGFYPGSGFQTTGNSASGAVRGRMEFGDRKLSSKIVARFVAASPEFTALVAQTAGAFDITMTGANGTSAAIAMPQIRYKTAKLDNTDGIVTVELDLSAQVPAGSTVGDLITITVNHTLGTVGR